MKINYLFSLVVGLLMLARAGIVSAQNDIVLPAATGVINIKTDYGAKGDGVTDDTDAIQRALNENGFAFETIYFPNGTYLVSKTLTWGEAAYQTGPSFWGESREGAIIRLKDNSYLNGPVVETGKNVYRADRFHNSVRNLTVVVGSGNPQASGIKFFSNNTGSLRDVTIFAEGGSGSVGVDVRADQAGPALVKNVEIIGFDYGVKVGVGGVNSMTFEDITVQDQKVCGFYNELMPVFIRNLISVNDVPAVWNTHDGSAMTLVDGSFTGGSSSEAAIVHEKGTIYIQNVNTTGYGQVLRSNVGAGITGDKISQYAYPRIDSEFSSPELTLDLPVEDTPDIPWETDLGQWANIEDFGGTAGDGSDDAAALQAAIDAGATTVYIPNRIKAGSEKRFNINQPVYIRGNVRRLVCFGSPLNFVGGKFVVENGTYPEIEFIGFHSWERMKMEHNTNRTLVIKSSSFEVKANVSGKIFIEDMTGTVHINTPDYQIWARQINTESNDYSNVINKGSDFWALGVKAERDLTIIETLEGGRSEVLGCLLYANLCNTYSAPAFIVEDASFSIAGSIQRHFCAGEGWAIQVRETRGGETKEFLLSESINAGTALYVGYPGSAPVPAAPANAFAAVNSYSKVTLSWSDNATNEEGFIVERKTGADGTYKQIAKVGYNINGITDERLSASTTYYYRVRAFNVGGESAYSNEVVVTTGNLPSVPAAPTNLAAAPFYWGEVALTWTDNSSNEEGFRIERRALNDTAIFEQVGVAPANATTYQVDGGLAPERSYEFRVRAYNVSGTSAYSNTASATTGSRITAGTGTITWDYWLNINGSRVSDLTKSPAFPDNPDGTTDLEQFQGPIGWGDNYGTRFRGYIHPPITGDYTFWIASDNGSQLFLSFDDSPANMVMISEVPDGNATPVRGWDVFSKQKSVAFTLEAGKKYYIEALHKAGVFGDHCAVAWDGPGISRELIDGDNLEPAVAATGAPVAPSNVSGINIKGTSLKLTWQDNAENELGHYIERKTAGGSFAQIASASAGSTFTDNSVQCETTYTYRIRAHNRYGTSPYSDEFTITTVKCGTGDGLLGEYFNDVTFNNLKLTRVDPQINMNWGGSPGGGVRNDDFTVRWTGEVEALYTEEYTFTTGSDDGARLWVNGQLLVDKLIYQGYTEYSGKINLVAGQRYDIKLEFLDGVGSAIINLFWESASQPRIIVPQERLHSAEGGGSTPTYPLIHSVSAETSSGQATSLIDGDTDGASRWAAEGFPQWVIIDYGENKSITGTRLSTYLDRAYQYKVEMSEDLDFTGDLVVDRLANTSGEQPIADDFPAVSARYVKITVTGASGYSGTWVSLTEFEIVEGEPEIQYPIIHSFSTENFDGPATNLIDGDTNGESRWAANGFPQWIIVDYGESKSITGTRLYAYQDRAYKFKVEMSEDLDFTDDLVVDRLANTSGDQPISDDFPAVSARYVKITVTGASGYSGTWASLTEFEIVEGEPDPSVALQNKFSEEYLWWEEGQLSSVALTSQQLNDWNSHKFIVIDLADGTKALQHKESGEYLWYKSNIITFNSLTDDQLQNWNSHKLVFENQPDGYFWIRHKTTGAYLYDKGADGIQFLGLPQSTWNGPKWTTVDIGGAATAQQSLKENFNGNIVSKRLNEIRFYPNPASGTIQVDLPVSEVGLQLVIQDLQGKTVLSRRLNESQTVDISNISAGMYLLRISQGSEWYTQKLLVE